MSCWKRGNCCLSEDKRVPIASEPMPGVLRSSEPVYELWGYLFEDVGFVRQQSHVAKAYHNFRP
jgi:hypothetical protein